MGMKEQNEITGYIVEKREELLDTLNSKNDTLRIVYRINTASEDINEEKLTSICEQLIAKEASVDYKAIAFFFWEDGMPVGEVGALASLTYAAGGFWESAMEQVGETAPMELVVDFNRYAE